MNYDKYIFDWQNELLEKDEYLNTNKYAFSLLNKAQNMLKEHIDKYDMNSDAEKNLQLINNLLIEIYHETSYIKLEFDNNLSEKW